MINIQRTRIDTSGNVIKPNSEWFKKAAKATKKALDEKDKHNADNNIYGHYEVRRVLEELFHNKCAYCECDISRFDWEVEHYRPKGKVRERKDHPGYYWLAYTWDNLYPSCTYCNQHRKEKPTWNNPKYGISGGKATQFPINVEKNRALKPTDNLTNESRLLLDPCEDIPDKYLGYSPDGQIYAIRNSKKGDVSIKVLNLKMTRLNNARRKNINAIVDLLKLLKKLKKDKNNNIANDIQTMIKNHFLNENNYFSGSSRFVVNNPELFGI